MRQTLNLNRDKTVALYESAATMKDKVARDTHNMHMLVEDRLYLSDLLAIIFDVGSILAIACLGRDQLAVRAWAGGSNDS